MMFSLGTIAKKSIALFKGFKIPLLLLTIAWLYTLLWYRGRCLTIGGDFVLTFYPFEELKRYTLSYNWFNEVGSSTPYSVASAFPLIDTIIMTLYQLLGLDIYTTNFMYVLTLTFISASSMFFLAYTIFIHYEHRLAISLLAVLTWLYSPWSIIDTYKSLVANLLRLDQSAFITSLALLIKLQRENKLRYAIQIGLLTFVMFEAFPVWSYRFFVVLTLAYIAIGLYVLLFKRREDKIEVLYFFLKAYGLTLAISALINFWRLYFFIKEQFTNFMSISARLPIGPWNKESTLLNTLRILNASGFKNYVPYADMYFKNPLIIVSSFLVPIFAFGALLLERNKKILYLALLTVLIIFLCKGENPPFGEIFILLVNFNIGSLYPFKAFHGTGILTMQVLTLEYACLIAFTVYRATLLIGDKLATIALKKYMFINVRIKYIFYAATVSILFIPLLTTSYPLLTGEVLENWWLRNAHNKQTFGVKIPEDYFQAGIILERNANVHYPLFRALLLPRPQTYIATSWGYQGTSAFYNRFFTVPLITGQSIGYGVYRFTIDPWATPLKMDQIKDLIPFIGTTIHLQSDFVSISEEGIFWKINTKHYVGLPHDVAFILKESQCWKNYTHLVLALNTKAVDPKRLLIGIHDVCGFVGWYTADNYLDKYDFNDNATFSLFVPLYMKPELSTFNLSSVNGIILRYTFESVQENPDIEILLRKLYVATGTPDSSLWANMLALLNVKNVIIDKSIEAGASNYTVYVDLLSTEFFDKLYESNNLIVFRNNVLESPIHILDIQCLNLHSFKEIIRHYQDWRKMATIELVSIQDNELEFTIHMHNSNTSSIIIIFPTPYDRNINLVIKSVKVSSKHFSFIGLNAWIIEGLAGTEKISTIISVNSTTYKLLLLTSVVAIIMSAVLFIRMAYFVHTKDYGAFKSKNKKIWERHAKIFIYKNVFGPFVDHLQFLKNKYNPKICLDLACGDGRFTGIISENTILTIGVDISRVRLRRAKINQKKTNVDFLLADASHLPFKNSSFDGIFVIELLEHMSLWERFVTLQEVKRIMKGFFFATLPNPLAPHSRLDPTHVLNYSNKTLRRIMEDIFLDKYNVLVTGSHVPLLKVPFWRSNTAIRNLLKYVPYISTTFVCLAVKHDENKRGQIYV